MTRATRHTPVSAARTAGQNVSDAASRAGDEVQRQAGNWMERLARMGYAAKGVLYLLIGVLALQAAIGWGGQIADSRSALSALEGRWGIGTVLLWLIAVGLVGYAMWNLLRASLDPENEGNDTKAIIKRIGFAVSGLIHASLAIWVFTHLLTGDGGGGGSGGNQTQDGVGRVLEWGLAGRIAVAIAGACVIGYGIHQLIRAWKVDLSDHLALSQMGPQTRTVAIFTGRFGMAARGIIFTMVGWFFLMAAWRSASGEAGGLADALRTVSSYGWVILAFVALGLSAYGVHMLITARFRRIETH